jgi:hypothetical protein
MQGNAANYHFILCQKFCRHTFTERLPGIDPMFIITV